jgi:hypothetical protein
MKPLTLINVLLALPFLFLGNTLSNAATVALDLVIHTPGINNGLTLNPGGAGVSSPDGMPFPLLGVDKAIGLFSVSSQSPPAGGHTGGHPCTGNPTRSNGYRGAWSTGALVIRL